jgi:hypothetical protein
MITKKLVIIALNSSDTDQIRIFILIMKMSTYKTLRTLAKYSKIPIGIFESILIEKYAAREPYTDPVFIIGAPRTGSTILYQILTNTFNFLYPDNLIELFNRNLFFGFLLSEIFYKHKAHNCFKSDFGNTVLCGLRAPHECGKFWYHWLPIEQHFVKKNTISQKSITDMRKTIYAIINRFKAPLLFKNLNNSLRLGLISEIAPNSKFIWIKRDPLFVAQSIYKAKENLKMEANEWWSVKPPNFDELRDLNGIEQIVRQIYYIEKQITLDKRYFPENNFIMVNYNELFEDNEYFLEMINRYLNNSLKKRKSYNNPDLKFSEKITLDESIISYIRDEIKNFDWDRYEL